MRAGLPRIFTFYHQKKLACTDLKTDFNIIKGYLYNVSGQQNTCCESTSNLSPRTGLRIVTWASMLKWEQSRDLCCGPRLTSLLSLVRNPMWIYEETFHYGDTRTGLRIVTWASSLKWEQRGETYTTCRHSCQHFKAEMGFEKEKKKSFVSIRIVASATLQSFECQ